MRKIRNIGLLGLLLIAMSIFIAGIGSGSAQAADWQTLLKQTMPEADKFTQVGNLTGYKSTSLTKAAFPAYKGDAQTGIIFYSAPQGYSGNIQTLVALDMNGAIRKVNVFGHTETPAYVGPLNDGNYQRQFEGITLSDKMVFLIGTRATRRGEIQAITGSTDTSKPIAIAVSEARKLFAEIYRK